MIDMLIKGVQHMLNNSRITARVAKENSDLNQGAYTLLLTALYVNGDISLDDMKKWDEFVDSI